jgi:hypothetical protein
VSFRDASGSSVFDGTYGAHAPPAGHDLQGAAALAAAAAVSPP